MVQGIYGADYYLFVLEGEVSMRIKEKWNLSSQRNVYQNVIIIITFIITIIMYSTTI